MTAEEHGSEEAPFLKLLGMEPDFIPDDEAPPVDRQKLAKLRSGQLTHFEREDVVASICAYRTWYKEWCRLLAESLANNEENEG